MSKEKKQRNKEIEKLYFNDHTTLELVERFSISKQRVGQVLKYQKQLKIQFRRLNKKDIKI